MGAGAWDGQMGPVNCLIIIDLDTADQPLLRILPAPANPDAPVCVIVCPRPTRCTLPRPAPSPSSALPAPQLCTHFSCDADADEGRASTRRTPPRVLDAKRPRATTARSKPQTAAHDLAPKQRGRTSRPQAAQSVRVAAAVLVEKVAAVAVAPSLGMRTGGHQGYLTMKRRRYSRW